MFGQKPNFKHLTTKRQTPPPRFENCFSSRKSILKIIEFYLSFKYLINNILI